MPRIIIIDTRKPRETKSIIIAPEQQSNRECLLGRDPRCCVALKDSLASRIHGKIAYRSGKYYYSDLGSKNGSKINNVDARINEEYPLKVSDTIALGNHLLWIEAIANVEVAAASQSLIPEQYMPLATIDLATLETWTQGTKQLKCVQIIDETADVKTFTLVCEPPIKFSYQPGQFVTLNLDINGRNVKCPYSIASTPSRPYTIEITVKRVASCDQPTATLGLASNWLHDNLKIGSQIKVDAPTGNFTNFAHPSRKLLLISAGNGIVPMMSMSRWIYDTVSDVDVVFLHSASSPEEIVFRQELEMMTARYPKFKLAITVTRPLPGQSWYGYTGKINEKILPAIAADYKDRTVYVCGCDLFVEAIKTLLQKMGFPMENYYEERFNELKRKKQSETLTTTTSHKPDLKNTALHNGMTSLSTSVFQPPSPPNTPSTTPPTVAPTSIFSLDAMSVAPESLPTPLPSDSSTIVLLKSEREISCDGTEVILNVAEAEGADLPFGCRVGACGACKVKKIQGKVAYSREVNCEEGFVYTCVARPVGRVVIEA